MSLSPPSKKPDSGASSEYSTDRRPATTLIDEKQWLYIQRRYKMSPRELEVAKLVCRGLTNDDIARELKVKPGTVKTHLRSIFGKARARSKIKMLLAFIDDAMNLPGLSRRPPIPIRQIEKSSRKTATLDESLRKE